jgi:hypothetical protein
VALKMKTLEKLEVPVDSDIEETVNMAVNHASVSSNLKLQVTHVALGGELIIGKNSLAGRSMSGKTC